MILNIIHGIDEPVNDEDSYSIPVQFINQKPVNLFIASQKWDHINIELDDCIDDGVLKYVVLGVEVTVKLPSTITTKTVRLLCEVFPEKSGKIRRIYIMGGDMSELLQ